MSNGIRLIVPEGADGRTARSLLRGAKGVSSRLMRKAVYDSGELTVNGQPARFVDRLRAGDEVFLKFPDESSWFKPQDIPLSILYEDEELLVLDKQPGIVVHPTKGHVSGTIANGIARHMQARGESYKIRFISRLDMDTSGVLLCGKNAHAQTDFARQAGEGSVYKGYLAIVSGALEGSGIVDAPIALEREGEPRRCVRPESEGGYPSRTEWESLRVLREDGFVRSLIRLRLLTGRTHQIRVHMAYLGHPVLGDALYGDGSTCPIIDRTSGTVPSVPRQMLHAARLCFRHPQTGAPLEFEAPLPADLRALLG